MRLSTEEMTLEEARAIVDADNARRSAELKAERVGESRKLLGRFFKHHERAPYDGLTHDPSRWWSYATPNAVNEWGQLSGLTFQRTPKEVIEVRLAERLDLHVGEGSLAFDWTEITASEFQKAAAGIRSEMLDAFSKNVKSPSRPTEDQ